MSRKENKSLASNFQVKSILGEESRKLNVEFIVNVNTSAERKSPYYSQTSICEIIFESELNQQENSDQQDRDSLGLPSPDEYFLIAVKTEKMVAIIELLRGQPKKEPLQLSISEKYMQRQTICYHQFVHRKVIINSASKNGNQNAISAPMYICFSTGKILVVEALASQFMYNFNASSEKGDEIWHQRKVTKVLTLPDGKRFLVLFADSAIVEYGLNARSENFEFQQDINKLEQQISFQPKKFGQAIQRKSYGTFEYSSISAGEFVGFACYSLEEDKYCGPNKYYSFKCPSISDFAILPQSHTLYQLTKRRFSRESFLVAFAGLDGFLRVVDLANFQPIYCYKTYYGGINSFTFDTTSENSPLIGLSCQDDSVVILNTRLNTSTRIIGHSSFVSYTVFTKISPTVVRLTAASFDGHFSITDFFRSQLDDPTQKDPDVDHEYLPLKLKYDPSKAKIVKILHMQKANEEGLAYLLGFKDYFLSSAFDGCASLFKYCDKIPEYIPSKLSEDSSTSSQYQKRGSTQSDYVHHQPHKISSDFSQEDFNNQRNNSNNSNIYQNNNNNNYNNNNSNGSYNNNEKSQFKNSQQNQGDQQRSGGQDQQQNRSGSGADRQQDTTGIRNDQNQSGNRVQRKMSNKPGNGQKNNF